MKYYFIILKDAKILCGRAGTTIPVIVNEDIKEAAKSKALNLSGETLFESTLLFRKNIIKNGHGCLFINLS